MFSNRFITAAVTLGAGVAIAATYGAVVSANHAWGNYHWERASNPVELTLGDNFKTSAWDSAYATAVSDWNKSAVLDLDKVGGGTSARRCKPANGNIEVCADKYGTNGWLGLAQIWISGDHITKALAKMNDSYFVPGGSYDTTAWRALVMCQEIGHDFGLGHQDENFTNTNLGTCMDYTGAPDGGYFLDAAGTLIDVGAKSNLHPDDHDYAQLASIYAHPDDGGDGGGGTAPPCRGGPKKCPDGQTPPPAFDMELPNSGQWGTPVAVSADGGQSVFVQNFGNGYRVLTHVTWTLEVAERLARR